MSWFQSSDRARTTQIRPALIKNPAFTHHRRIRDPWLSPVHAQLAPRVENGWKKSRPDPYRFLHLTRPFHIYEKYGNRTKTGEGLFRLFLRDPVFFRIEPVFILYLINMGRA
jgi:hypothetical protein